MSETPQDPAGTTHQFRAFANQGQPEKTGGANTGLIVGVIAAVALVAVVAAVVLMML